MTPSTSSSPRPRLALARSPGSVRATAVLDRGLTAFCVVILSISLPRVAALKASEFAAVAGAVGLFRSKRLQSTLLRCYWPLIVASVYAFFLGYLMLWWGPMGDGSLSSDKAIYSRPE
jgi:hypothetical protein